MTIRTPRSERRPERRRPPVLLVVSAVLAVCGALLPAPAPSQETVLWAAGAGDARRPLTVAHHRGYATLPAGAMTGLGWAVTPRADGVELRLGERVRVSLTAGSAFLRWNGEVRQLADDPYLFGDQLWVPVQMVLDLLPAELPGLYALDAGGRVIRVLDADVWREGERLSAASPSATVEWPPARSERPPSPAERPRPGGGTIPAVADPVRVVVIDAGHGGRDPGAVGRGGVREKDVALGIALELARELERIPHLEVHLTRDRDVLVPIWQRGQRATEWKGDRPGVFVSIHANALPTRRSARGFETYFLAEARTDHARRVAANENAPLALEQDGDAPAPTEDLRFILRELRNLDHQHWSVLLGELIHDEMGPVHPGPDRGVKQAPLAVITNALMPAVLFEVGFLTNADEERLLSGAEFQRDVARSLSRAIVAFFERYPPAPGPPVEGSR